jgi:hypothetical protein
MPTGLLSPLWHKVVARTASSKGIGFSATMVNSEVSLYVASFQSIMSDHQ